MRKARRERELRLWRQHDIAYVNACAETVRAAILVVGVSHLIDRSRKYIRRAFGKIVTSLVNDLFMPLIGLLTGGSRCPTAR